jgi:putative Mg2+ transporter-C (MgtC) family protein
MRGFDAIWNEMSAGWPDPTQIERVVFRLLVAAILGALVGIERERAGKWAGVRTHMLVSLGTTLFIVVSSESGMSGDDLSRVIQGLAAGIGFIGAGTILKLADEREITGLTTAAGIWMTAAIGVGVGLGRWGSSVIGVLLTLLILALVGRFTGHKDDAEKRP